MAQHSIQALAAIESYLPVPLHFANELLHFFIVIYQKLFERLAYFKLFYFWENEDEGVEVAEDDKEEKNHL